ncbi:MAG: hypothetical protein JWQ36_2181, partial [Enterovirga sp.]|nr:hypothetical protein [Enterovirga sp.]
MKTFVLLAFLSCGLAAGASGDAAAQPAPNGAPPEPVTTGSASGAATAPARGRASSHSAQQGGIYARPGRCRELAIGRKLSGLARQRFIKRCRVARRAMPRPVPSA